MSDFKIPESAQKQLAEGNVHMIAEGARLRDEAMERVYAAAPEEIKTELRRAVRAVAEREETFSSDDVWFESTLKPTEPRVLGPIMRIADRAGICEKTEKHIYSVLPQNHRRRILIWRSLVLGSSAAASKDVELSADTIRIGRMTLTRESRGHGFVCAECRCEIDYYGRGPHKPGCSNMVHNESLLPGAEEFQRYMEEFVKVPPAGAGA